mgnify:CR=1 FL=1
MANAYVPDQSDEFKKKMTLITDVASDRHLAKSKENKKKGKTTK